MEPDLPINKVISQLDTSPVQKEMLNIFWHIFVMPLSACLSLGILTYFVSKTVLEIPTALLFVFSFCGWITLWVVRHLQKLRNEYELQMGQIISISEPVAQEKARQQALLILTKSSILYVLIIGYLAIAFGFAVIYDALNVSSQGGFWNNFYFSISTITTVGFGDIAPHGIGRLFASIQMIYGILYQVLAVSVGTTLLIRLTHKN